MLASDFGEEHETQVAFARTSPHRTDPACVMGRDRPGTNARRSHRNGDGHVRRAHAGGGRDRERHGPTAPADVTVTNTPTPGTRNTVTNGEGVYSFPALPPGSYQIKVKLQGFKT